MRKVVILLAVAVIVSFCINSNAFARIKYINGYQRSSGTYVSGHYRDVSNDGNPYNNANYLGYND